MPWDSFRKKLSTDSSFGATRKRDQQQQQPQRLAHHDQSYRSPQATQHAFANVVDQVVASKTHEQRPTTSYASQTSTTSTSKSSQGLAPDVYRRIKEVDQEQSTLTATGVRGLSARILEKNEFSQALPDGTSERCCYQTVEIYKRPGQSLGLYLREGNSEDRFDGIFVSRLQEGSDLLTSGVLHVGDEVLSVNKVDVTQRNIDEVVVMISIPRRLLLRTRSIIDGDGQGAAARGDFDGGKFIKPLDFTPVVKPIAVIKQLPRDESRESSMTDDGAPLASSQLIATAQTSLGARARQQESTSSLSEATMQYSTISSRVPPAPHRTTSSATLHQSRLRERTPLTQRSLSDRWSSGQQLATMHQSRALDVGARVSGVETDFEDQGSNDDNGDVWQKASGGGEFESSSASAGHQSTLARTAYLPPPRLQGHLPIMGRPAGLVSMNQESQLPVSNPPMASGMSRVGPALYQMPPSVPSLWNPMTTNPPPAEFDPSVFSPRSAISDSRATAPGGMGAHQPPRSVLRQPSAFPTSIFPSIKSNSLPRRHPTGRTIKWRNDVSVGGSDAAMAASAINYDFYLQGAEISDSDGAVSAPELALSLGNSFVPPPFSTPHTPTTGKTIDELFSRSEYQAWNPYPNQSLQSRRYDDQMRVDPGGVAEQRYYAQLSSEQRPFGASGVDDEYGYYLTQSTNALPSRGRQRWAHRVEDTSGAIYSGGAAPVPILPLIRASKRSSSLPPRGLLNQQASTIQDYDHHIYENLSDLYGEGTLRRRGAHAVDISPLARRRLPLSLAAAKPSFGYAIDSQLQTEPYSLTGVLYLRIIEGRQIRARDPEEMYCVVEVDGEHRARTEVSDWQSGFHWNEVFEIDVWECRRVDFYIYSWHPQYRHKLRHRGFLQLLDTLLAQRKFDFGDELEFGCESQLSHSFSLNLDPRGQLFVQVGFQGMAMAYRRQLATRRSSYWGVPLQNLVERESTNVPGGGHVPTVFRRLTQEIERRGVDATGLYILCGSSSKKYLLRDQLERQPNLADLSPDVVPDLNVLTSVFKDFLRELPEPLVPNCTFQMLLEAWKVCVPNDKEGNAKLMLGVIDCLTKVNKCTFMVLMDHLKYVVSQSPHNGLSTTKCGVVFGPLICCTSQAYQLTPPVDFDPRFGPLKPYFTFLDYRLAARLLETLLELWPSPRTSSESSGSENSTMNLTGNGDTSLVDLWLQENRLPESTC